jgi:hypothetical protein
MRALNQELGDFEDYEGASYYMEIFFLFLDWEGISLADIETPKIKQPYLHSPYLQGRSPPNLKKGNKFPCNNQIIHRLQTVYL